MSKNVDYELEVQDLYNECRRLAFEEENWTSKYNKDDIHLYSAQTSYCPKCPCYKLETTINMPAERVVDTLNPFGPYRMQYDTNIINVKLLEEISDTCVILYKKFQPRFLGFGLRQADAIDIAIFDKTDDYYYALHKGVEYEGHQESFGGRTHSYPTGMFVFNTDDPSVSRLLFLWHVDVKPPNIVPSIVVDKISSSTIIKIITGLKSMKDLPYKRLESDVPFCRRRKS